MDPLGNANMAAKSDRRGDYYSIGVFDWLYCQFVFRLGCLGLQRCAREYPGADMRTVYDTLAPGISGGDRAG